MKEIKNKVNTNKITEGSIFGQLLLFFFPILFGTFFQQLYNIADSLVAGKLVGENALAAVGNSYEITLILIAFSFGCNMGCSVLVSQLFGAKRYGELKSAVSTACIFSGILCLGLMAFTIFGGEMLLHLIKTPEDIFADSTIYLDIYVYGLPFVFFYNIATGIFSGLGDLSLSGGQLYPGNDSGISASVKNWKRYQGAAV